MSRRAQNERRTRRADERGRRAGDAESIGEYLAGVGRWIVATGGTIVWCAVVATIVGRF